MKKRKVLAGFVFFLAVMSFVGCPVPQPPAPYPTGAEFAGIWSMSGGGLTETLTIWPTTFTIADSGVINGTLNMSIVTYDEAANHIRTSVTSGSGAYAGLPVGTNVYFTYSIASNTMMIALDMASYPAVANIGPYIKQ